MTVNEQRGSWPTFSGDEINAAATVLRSGRVNYWTGHEGRLFEQEFSGYIGCSHGVALANGTVALEAALRALGVTEGDEVVVPARTFIATASAVVACGALPVVCDVDAISGNATAKTIEQTLTPRTKAVIPVHLAGWPCDMDAIMDLAHAHGLSVVEDCAQAHGAALAGRKVGSFGDVGAFSFCQDKIISTCGEGGMVTTDDEALWRRMWEYKDHGRGWDAVRDAAALGGHEYKPVYESFGTNFRMTEMQAAVGRVQLRKLDGWLTQRRVNAAVLDERLAHVNGIRVAVPSEVAKHAYYKYYAYIEPDALGSGWSRNRILDEVSGAGVPCQSGVCPEIQLEKAFSSIGIQPLRQLPIAKRLGETSLMLQVHPTLTEADMHRAADVIAGVMGAAVR
jgi:dTDP-4-amino-4,6-dideoxygalactose transaminase